MTPAQITVTILTAIVAALAVWRFRLVLRRLLRWYLYWLHYKCPKCEALGQECDDCHAGRQW